MEMHSRPYRPLAACALLSLLPCLVQCDSRKDDATTVGKGAKSSKPQAAPAVAVVVEERDGLAYRPGETTPFTGEAVELYPDLTPAAVLRRIPYVEGKKHGSVTRWTPKGKITEDRRYEHGVPKTCVNYHSNGQKKIQVVLNAQDKAEGPHFRWYDNGVLQVESAFDSEERFHGEEKLYNREGTLIGHYRNEHGKFMEALFETPEAEKDRLAHWAKLEAAAKEAAEKGEAAVPPSKE